MNLKEEEKCKGGNKWGIIRKKKLKRDWRAFQKGIE